MQALPADYVEQAYDFKAFTRARKIKSPQQLLEVSIPGTSEPILVIFYPKSLSTDFILVELTEIANNVASLTLWLGVPYEKGRQNPSRTRMKPTIIEALSSAGSGHIAEFFG